MVLTCPGRSFAKPMKWYSIFVVFLCCSCSSQKVSIQKDKELLFLDEISAIQIEYEFLSDSFTNKICEPIANPFTRGPRKITINATQSRTFERQRVKTDSIDKQKKTLLSVPSTSYVHIFWLFVCVMTFFFIYFLRNRLFGRGC